MLVLHFRSFMSVCVQNTINTDKNGPRLRHIDLYVKDDKEFLKRDLEQDLIQQLCAS